MWFIKLLHRLHIVKAVWLLDFKGQCLLTIKKKNPFGGYWAYVYPFTHIGHVILNDDGTCSGESTYIDAWKDYGSNAKQWELKCDKDRLMWVMKVES